MEQKNNKDINKLCAKCMKKCKQSAEVILLTCPNFEQRPEQLEIKFGSKKYRRN